MRFECGNFLEFFNDEDLGSFFYELLDFEVVSNPELWCQYLSILGLWKYFFSEYVNNKQDGW